MNRTNSLNEDLTKKFFVGEQVKVKTAINFAEFTKKFAKGQKGTVVSVHPKFIVVRHENGWNESFDRLEVHNGMVM